MTLSDMISPVLAARDVVEAIAKQLVDEEAQDLAARAVGMLDELASRLEEIACV